MLHGHWPALLRLLVHLFAGLGKRAIFLRTHFFNSLAFCGLDGDDRPGAARAGFTHGFVPDDYLSQVLGNENWYSVPLAILVGVPLYSNAAGIIPIVSVLIEKGVSLGTALAFMMSVIALSLPEIIILKKILNY